MHESFSVIEFTNKPINVTAFVIEFHNSASTLTFVKGERGKTPTHLPGQVTDPDIHCVYCLHCIPACERQLCSISCLHDWHGDYHSLLNFGHVSPPSSLQSLSVCACHLTVICAEEGQQLLLQYQEKDLLILCRELHVFHVSHCLLSFHSIDFAMTPSSEDLN